MTDPGTLRIVFIGLSITSSWGNGHATNYRGLMRALTAAGHDVLFLERDVPWYAEHRDLPEPPYGRTRLYTSLDDLRERFTNDVAEADLVVVGSYVPEGVEVAAWALRVAHGVRAFYDIDTPVTLADLTAGRCEFLTPALMPHFDLYLSFTGGPTLHVLEHRWGVQRAVAFYCLVDADSYRPVAVPTRWDLGYLGTYSPDRQPMLDSLLFEPARLRPELSAVVGGARFPAELEWPTNVEHHEHISPDRHPRFYCSQRATINVTRADMVRAGWSPSVRLFEAAACGVPIVSDPWEGLGDIFHIGEEILVARNAAEVLAHLDALDDERRAALAGAARRRVLAEHTAEHRAEQLIGHVRDLISTGGRR